MKYENIVTYGTILIQILLAIIAVIMISAFAMRPTDSVMLSNALLTILILVQLFTINILINMYNKLGGRRR